MVTIEVRCLTNDGGTATLSNGQVLPLIPNTIQTYTDPVSITIAAPGGETAAEGQTAPSQ